MAKYITKEIFPELVAKCWEKGIRVEFEPARNRVWIKIGSNYEFVEVYEENLTVDSLFEILSKQ